MKAGEAFGMKALEEVRAELNKELGLTGQELDAVTAKLGERYGGGLELMGEDAAKHGQTALDKFNEVSGQVAEQAKVASDRAAEVGKDVFEKSKVAHALEEGQARLNAKLEKLGLFQNQLDAAGDAVTGAVGEGGKGIGDLG